MSDSLIPALITLKRDASGTWRTRFVHALVLTAGLTLSTLTAASAVQVGTNKFVFDRAPRLVSASTTQPAASINGGTYQFTLVVPQDAGAPLQAVTISQAGNAGKIQFAMA